LLSVDRFTRSRGPPNIDYQRHQPEQTLLHLLTLIVRCIPAFFRSHREQVFAEPALRQQLASYDQRKTKSRLTPLDRAFWVALSRLWPRISMSRAVRRLSGSANNSARRSLTIPPRA
jgi:hypothetical protein